MKLNPQDLIDAIGNDPQFIRGTPVDPVQDDENVYYISVGQKGVNYTLRVLYRDYGYRGERIVRDRYVRNLGPNAEGAVRKAKAYTKEPIYWQPIETRPRARARASDVIKFGKYEGMTLEEVADNDPGYIVWMAQKAQEPNSFLQKKKYATFLRELERVVQEHPEVSRLLGERRAAEEERERRREEERLERERKKARRGYFGTEGERFETWVTYERSFDFDTQYGVMYIHVFEDDDENRLVWKTSKALLDDEYERYARGAILKIRGTVKRHSEYRGEKQTEISRVKVLEERGRVKTQASTKKLKAKLLR